MTRLRAAVAGVVDFVAGDDLPLAVGIVLTIAVTYLLGRSGTHAWWLPPIAVTLLVAVSVWRVVRRKNAA
jgi:hypothetical protein